MQIYNPKNWIVFLFKIHRSDSLKVLFPLMMVIAIYTVIIVYLEQVIFQVNAQSHITKISLVQGLLGFVLSLLLVFRTNTAYDRWWEGRKQWGKLTNDCRNLGLKLHSMLDESQIEERRYFKRCISLFTLVLSEHLSKESTRLSLDENDHPEFHHAFTKNHKPAAIAKIIFVKIMQLYKNNQISGDQLRYLQTHLDGLMEVCGACERIKNTPIPFSYASFIKRFIAIYILVLPLGYAQSLGYWSILLTVFVFYVLVSLELIAEEIEDPFNNDFNDIPTDKIADNIGKSLDNIL